MAGLFVVVSRVSVITALGGWAGRIRTRTFPFRKSPLKCRGNFARFRRIHARRLSELSFPHSGTPETGRMSSSTLRRVEQPKYTGQSSSCTPNDRYGANCDIRCARPEVRFTSESGNPARSLECPLSANRRRPTQLPLSSSPSQSPAAARHSRRRPRRSPAASWRGRCCASAD